MLAVLAMQAGKTVPSDELCLASWNELWSHGLDGKFRPLMRRLRKTLGDEGLISTESLGYRLCARPDDVDILAFEALGKMGTATARAGDWQQALRLLMRAEALWQGSPFADVPSDHLRGHHVPYLEKLLLLVRQMRIEAAVRLSPPRASADVLPELEVLVRANPGDEHLRWLLMLALYRARRQGDALTEFMDFWRYCKIELGREPDPALKGLNQRMLLSQQILLREPLLESLADWPSP